MIRDPVPGNEHEEPLAVAHEVWYIVSLLPGWFVFFLGAVAGAVIAHLSWAL